MTDLADQLRHEQRFHQVAMSIEQQEGVLVEIGLPGPGKQSYVCTNWKEHVRLGLDRRENDAPSQRQ